MVFGNKQCGRSTLCDKLVFMFEQENYEYELKKSGQMNKKDFMTLDMI